MTIKITVLKETKASEKRVAATPETVKKLIGLGGFITVQSGAGEGASIRDQAYKNAGATLASSASEALKGTHIVLKVQGPTEAELKSYPKGALVIGNLAPFDNHDYLKALADHDLSAFSMELVPRITRAQSMDVLSSQSNLAGYKSVLDACEYYGKAFPMMMTAAGTIPPTKVFVMGAGVAGLQAIATARRLGAVVSATDVRPAAKEQVESLGGNFVAVIDDEFKQAETSGGYAKEMSKEYQAKQAALVAEHIAKQDIVITTALIPGRPAPKLITQDMVKSMKPGSVIVDLAVETGGNCALSKAGEVVSQHGVTIIGHLNVPSRLAADASSLYSRNLLNLLTLIIDKDKAALDINWDDDIVKGIALIKEGKIIHPNFKGPSISASKTEHKTAVKKSTGQKPKQAAPVDPQAKAPSPKKTTAKKAGTSKAKTTATKKTTKSEPKE